MCVAFSDNIEVDMLGVLFDLYVRTKSRCTSVVLFYIYSKETSTRPMQSSERLDCPPSDPFMMHIFYPCTRLDCSSCFYLRQRIILFPIIYSSVDSDMAFNLKPVAQSHLLDTGLRILSCICSAMQRILSTKITSAASSTQCVNMRGNNVTIHHSTVYTPATLG